MAGDVLFVMIEGRYCHLVVEVRDSATAMNARDCPHHFHPHPGQRIIRRQMSVVLRLGNHAFPMRWYHLHGGKIWFLGWMCEKKNLYVQSPDIQTAHKQIYSISVVLAFHRGGDWGKCLGSNKIQSDKNWSRAWISHSLAVWLWAGWREASLHDLVYPSINWGQQ